MTCVQCNQTITTMPIYEMDGFLICTTCGSPAYRRNKPAERMLFGNYDYYRCLICQCEIATHNKAIEHLKFAHSNEKIYRLNDYQQGKIEITNCTNEITIIVTDYNLYRIDTNAGKRGMHISIMPFKTYPANEESVKFQYVVRGAIKMNGYLPIGSTPRIDHPVIGESIIAIIFVGDSPSPTPPC